MSATATAATTTAPRQPRLLRGMHHTGYVTHDSQATVDFYTKVMGMEFVCAVTDDTVPSTGDPFPYMHLFFMLGDGSTLAFFESIGLPPPAKSTHPGYDVFTHLALNAETREEVDAWAAHLRAKGVDFIGPVDHGIIYSLYFYDPNGVRLELTATTDDSWVHHHDQAMSDLAGWEAAKRKDRAQGTGTQAVKAWIASRRQWHRPAGKAAS